jgi:hypothetical protein
LLFPGGGASIRGFLATNSSGASSIRSIKRLFSFTGEDPSKDKDKLGQESSIFSEPSSKLFPRPTERRKQLGKKKKKNQQKNNMAGVAAARGGGHGFRVFTFRNVLLLDAAVCVFLILQLLLSPSTFVAASGMMASSDMLRLFAGIYCSWTFILVFLAFSPAVHTSGLAWLLAANCAFQWILGWFSLTSTRQSFFLTNQIMLALWLVVFVVLALRTKTRS